MADRELLELAAKAADIAGVYDTDFDMLALLDSEVVPTMWNPLKDDGDALRLAVTLRILVGIHTEDSWAQHYVGPDDGWRTFKEPHGEDPMAATRRAIVRAAAEIGKAMP